MSASAWVRNACFRSADLAPQRGVGAQLRNGRVELRVVPVVLVLEVRLGEHEVLGDPAQLRVAGGHETCLALLRLEPEVRGPERDPRHEPPDRGRCALVDLAVVERAAPHAEVAQVLERDDVARLVEPEVGRQRLARDRRVRLVGLGLADRPLHGERPPLAEHPHPRQRLLEHDARAPGSAAERTMNTRLRFPSPTSRTVSGPAGSRARSSGRPSRYASTVVRLERLVRRPGRSVDPHPVLVVRIVDRRRDEQHLGRRVELAAVGRVGRDDPHVALLDRPGRRRRP